MTFTDDFNRADGPLGANWGYLVYAPTIVSQRAYAGNNGGQGVCLAETSALAHDATITILLDQPGPFLNGPGVKAPVTGYGGYYFLLSGASGAYTGTIKRYGDNVTVATALIPIALPNTTTLRLTYNQGSLYAYVNGVPWVWGQDTTYDANLYTWMNVGRYANSIDSFTCSVGEVTAFSVSPNYAQANGPAVALTLNGTGTAWTPGTPGAPTFTASAGSLSGQSVSSPSLATVWLTPPVAEGSVVITDPSTGLTDTVYCTASGEPPPAGGFTPKLTDNGAALINRSGELPGTPMVVADQSVVIPGALGAPDLTFLSAISDIWYAHYATWAGLPPSQTDAIGQILWNVLNQRDTMGAGPWPVGYSEPLATTLRAIKELWLNTEGTDFLTAQELLDAILAVGTPDLSAVRADIGIAGQSTWTSLLELLLAMWGTSTPTLTDIATLISDISTIAGYTLGDVLTAIAAQDVAGARSDILAAIAALRGDSLSTVAGIYPILSDLNDALQEVKTSLQEIRAPGAYTFADVLDAIAAIPTGGGGGGAGAPAWPGLGSVTIGAQWPLTTGLTVTAPMDGVVVQITAVAPKLNGHAYTYHDILCYRNVGALAFVSDRGDVETYQALGFTSAIYTPRAMQRAAAVKIMTPAGTAGSVRPWTINP